MEREKIETVKEETIAEKTEEMEQKEYGEEQKSSEQEDTLPSDGRFSSIHYEKKSFLFLVLALVTFNITLVILVISYFLVKLQIRQGAYEEPAYTAFFIGIPLFVLVALLLGLSWAFHKKWKNSEEDRESEYKK